MEGRIFVLYVDDSQCLSVTSCLAIGLGKSMYRVCLVFCSRAMHGQSVIAGARHLCRSSYRIASIIGGKCRHYRICINLDSAANRLGCIIGWCESAFHLGRLDPFCSVGCSGWSPFIISSRFMFGIDRYSAHYKAYICKDNDRSHCLRRSHVSPTRSRKRMAYCELSAMVGFCCVHNADSRTMGCHLSLLASVAVGHHCLC